MDQSHIPVANLPVQPGQQSIDPASTLLSQLVQIYENQKLDIHRPLPNQTPHPIPLLTDTIPQIHAKLLPLVQAVMTGQSISLITGYRAAANHSGTDNSPSPTQQAEAQMPRDDLAHWTLYKAGNYPLPAINWTTDFVPDIDTSPTTTAATRSLRNARRRAEALNHLYKTSLAKPEHAAWFSTHYPVNTPLVKAMVRVLGAERNVRGGQAVLDAGQLADLQTIKAVLSVVGRVVAEKGMAGKMAKDIGAGQLLLGRERERLRVLMGGGRQKKRGREEEEEEAV